MWIDRLMSGPVLSAARLRSQAGWTGWVDLTPTRPDPLPEVDDLLAGTPYESRFRKVSVNVAPRPALFATAMLPPWASRMRLQMLNPSP
jgi:hypothetical protein